MERLTLKNHPVCDMASTDYCRKHRDCYECGHGRKVFKLLSAYEDTELTPEQVTALKSENERLRAERDAAVEDLTNYQNPCGSCIHRTKCSKDYPCRKCRHMEENRYRAGFVNYFVWRGIEETP